MPRPIAPREQTALRPRSTPLRPRVPPKDLLLEEPQVDCVADPPHEASESTACTGATDTPATASRESLDAPPPQQGRPPLSHSFARVQAGARGCRKQWAKSGRMSRPRSRQSMGSAAIPSFCMRRYATPSSLILQLASPTRRRTFACSKEWQTQRPDPPLAHTTGATVGRGDRTGLNHRASPCHLSFVFGPC
eukprot:15356546-Alexandrium_andersonii.AAC.2